MSKLPTKDEILNWISENPTQTSKRDIARAFGIKGAQRIDLKRLLKELEDEGHLERRRKTYRDPDRLPPVTVLQALGPDAAGALYRPRHRSRAGRGRPHPRPADRGEGRRLPVRGPPDPQDRLQPAQAGGDLPQGGGGGPDRADRQGH